MKAAAAGGVGQNQPPNKGVPAERKIKYTGNLQIICQQFEKAEDGLLEAIKTHKGRIAHSETTTNPGAPRSGLWRVRVPIPDFEAFRDAVRKLGEVEKNTSDSEDVTELYYDLENHIKNKLAEEESLRKLLEKSGNEKIENILAVRKELAEVRDHINRAQGKLNMLANLTELTTVTVTLREQQKYVAPLPPDIAETPTFGMRAENTFTRSWDAFVAFLQAVMLAVVALVPWLGLVLVIGGPLVLLSRRWKRPVPAVVEAAQPTPPPSA